DSRSLHDALPIFRWVELLADSVLRHLVDTALEANRDVRTARAVIDEFRAQYRATRGALLPDLSANGTGGRNQVQFGTFGAQTFNVYKATADARWEVDLWGRLRRAPQAARADLLAQAGTRRAAERPL